MAASPSVNGAAIEPESIEDQGIELSVTRLQRLIQEFLTAYLREKSRETVGTYRRSLNEFERWFVRGKGTCRFRTEDIEDYKTYLMEERGLHQVSVSTYLTAVRRLCQFLVDAGLLQENPAKAVKGNRRPVSHSRKFLSEEYIAQLLATMDQAGDSSDEIAKRDRAIVYAMLFAGLSEIEIVRCNVQDLEQTLLGWYLRIQGKGHTIKDQQVPIDPPVMDALRLYLDTRGRITPESPLFVSHGHRSDGQRLNTRSVRSRINHHLEQSGIKRRGITPHSLTHTAALIWLNDGLSIEDVKQRMRHGTLDTTMIYFRQQGKLAGEAAGQ
ncbi:MAG: tyrosine-type recombinase/integrase [Bacteroidetes bacterium]|nr:tyrosine-type recombinase/integrase [Bacteroidota bacterium]MDA0875372.1 tyrosine-type recombinase/integrase [Bacteroidota bacterium]